MRKRKSAWCRRVKYRFVCIRAVPSASSGPTGAPPPSDAPVTAAAIVDEPDLLDPAVLAAETDLAGAALSPEERLKQAFPGAQEV